MAQTANAAAQLLVGVDKVRFAWSPPSGATTGYWVSRSLNGAAFQTYAYSTTPTIEIPVTVGDELMIAVAAVATNSSGALIVGPQSPISDRIYIEAAPRYPSATGAWLLRCATCPGFMRRALSDATTITGQIAGPPASWRALGRGKLTSSRYQVVWQDSNTGQLALYDEKTLAPVAGAVGVTSLNVRGVGSADFNGDGKEEFIMQRTDSFIVTLWNVTSAGFVSVGTLPGPAGALLQGARDFDRDGKIDLLWRDTFLGTLESWTVNNNPLLSLSASQLYKLPVTKLVTGLGTAMTVAATGDFDGDGWVDLLWRDGDGSLSITYLSQGRVRNYFELPLVIKDVERSVVGSVELDGTPGEEIALQHRTTKAITIVDPQTAGVPRTTAINPGGDWKVIAIGS